MTITSGTLTGSACVAAGALITGVPLAHPQLNVASDNGTGWPFRSSLRLLIPALVLVVITGLAHSPFHPPGPQSPPGPQGADAERPWSQRREPPARSSRDCASRVAESAFAW